MIKTHDFLSPIGVLRLRCTDEHLIGLDFTDEIQYYNISPIIELTIHELHLYFQGELSDFTVQTHLEGTEFQKSVWEALRSIPHGETKTYKEIAKLIGNPNAYRAVGNANNKNPISIIYPCHRVIGADGELVGYGGGLDKKSWLLAHEKIEIDFSTEYHTPVFI